VGDHDSYSDHGNGSLLTTRLFPIRTAQVPFGLSAFSPPLSPPSPGLPLRLLLTSLSAVFSRPTPPSSHVPLRLLVTSLSGYSSLPSPPSSHVPLRLLVTSHSGYSSPPSPATPHLPLRLLLTSLHAEGAARGTEDPQFHSVAFSRDRVWNWVSHACPIPLPAMARRVRCERDAHIDAQTLSRPRRRAEM